ncbi:hypothetical protein F5Y16DRAFT_394231 [Xylariaceae sp. FL0255]|nr:hypothetical protein F5Y16DRAFT_394231 [Xylariaceae sp. FL0255]
MLVVIKPQPDTIGKNKDRAESDGDKVAWIILAPQEPGWLTVRPVYNVIRSTLGDLSEKNKMVTYSGGFFHCVARAFHQDLHLVIRPDDVWLAILVQLNFYINGNAEKLRSIFVDHDGQKPLAVDIRSYSWDTIGNSELANKFTELIQASIKKPGFKNWFLPKFTTTTADDISTAGIALIGTMKQYFKYVLMGGCGFPSITILGERQDWATIHDRIDTLRDFGDEAAEWARLLKIIAARMLACFDDPDSDSAKDFWMRAVHRAGKDGSGEPIVRSYSGWLTAFCFWDQKGNRISSLASSKVLQLTEDQKPLILDGIEFPMIHPTEVPFGSVDVPLVYEDFDRRQEVHVKLTAGHFGASVYKDPVTNDDIFQPRSGWFMTEEETESKSKRARLLIPV